MKTTRREFLTLGLAPIIPVLPALPKHEPKKPKNIRVPIVQTAFEAESWMHDQCGGAWVPTRVDETAVWAFLGMRRNPYRSERAEEYVHRSRRQHPALVHPPRRYWPYSCIAAFTKRVRPDAYQNYFDRVELEEALWPPNDHRLTRDQVVAPWSGTALLVNWGAPLGLAEHVRHSNAFEPCPDGCGICYFDAGVAWDGESSTVVLHSGYERRLGFGEEVSSWNDAAGVAHIGDVELKDSAGVVIRTEWGFKHRGIRPICVPNGHGVEIKRCDAPRPGRELCGACLSQLKPLFS